MLTHQPTTLLFTQLLDLLPDGVVCYDAIRDQAGSIVDFRLTYFNEQFRTIAPPPYQLEVGVRMMADNPGQVDILAPIVSQYALVVDRDEVADYAFYDPNLDAYLALRVKKLGDGVLVTIRNVTEQQEQARLLNQLLDTSPTCIVSYKAQRDQYGQIVDFRLISLNQKALDTAKLDQTQVQTSTLLQLYPDQWTLFEQLTKVVQMGQAINVDVLIPSFGGWHNVSIAPSGPDEAVAVFVDITEKKAAALEAERRKNELDKVLNSSITGMLMCQAVTDETGGIVDFQVVFYNQSALAITGYTAEQVMSLRLSELDPAGATGGMYEGYLHVLSTGEPLRVEYFFEPNQRWLEVSVVRFTDEQVIVSFLDISILKETQLREQAQALRFSTILDGSPEGVITFESMYDDLGNLINLRYVQCNRAAHQLAQLPNDVIGRTLLDVYSGDESQRLLVIASQVMTSGESTTVDVHYAVGGFDKWYSLSVARLDDGVVCTFLDITQSRQASHLIEAKNRQLDSILNTSLNGTIVFQAIRDEQGDIVDFWFELFNQTAREDIMARTGKDIAGSTLLTIYPDSRQTGVFDEYSQVINTGQPLRLERHLPDYNTWYAVSITKLDDGCVVTFTDISQSKQAALVIKEAAAKLQGIIDMSQTGIFLFSPVRDESGRVVDFRFKTANRTLADYVGQKSDILQGDLGSRWFPAYKTNGLFDRYLRTYETGESIRFDFYYKADGIDSWLDIAATRLGDDVLVTFADFTPLKRLQQQLELSVQELKRSNANLEQFAYVASHDLQEPLRKVITFGDVLQSQYAGQLSESGADIVRRMQSAAQRMQTLIRDLLAYSRVANKRDTFREVNLNQVISEVVSDLDTTIHSKKAVLQVGSLPTIQGDELQLRQLFQNLLSNALKFSKPDVQPLITISSRLVAAQEIDQLTVATSQKFAEITVADNGIGFEQAYAERIFQLFQRLHTRSNYSGTGIGLSIVEKVVENHRGIIRAEGRLGQGASFVILFPTENG
ncbi:PAS domain-containing protein [Fibrisoma limi]|nr:PAS domain-containing protein [Fibrisoma limi]